MQNGLSGLTPGVRDVWPNRGSLIVCGNANSKDQYSAQAAQSGYQKLPLYAMH
jgi:hypothetical protein